MTRRGTTTYGFARTSKLLESRITKVSERRGFAQSRVLTHWEEIVGADLASMTRPVDVSYGRQGMGATLTVLTTGAMAPLVDMRKQEIRERINAVYGYNAIARLRVTQTAATGFADGQVSFDHRKAKPSEMAPSPEIQGAARAISQDIENTELRAALERLAANVISKHQGRS